MLRRKRERGASLIEYAIALLLLFGTIELVKFCGRVWDRELAKMHHEMVRQSGQYDQEPTQ